MHFKVDENLHPDVAGLLQKHGHDVLTVWDQNLQGKPDRDVAAAVQKEKRVPITLDKGFADIRTYPPNQFHGLIVCRLEFQNRANLLAVFANVLRWLELHPLEGRLWIVEENELRIRGDSPDQS